jgi:O-antigen/teichoic acid export membrane protein
VSLQYASWQRVREVGSFGAWNFLASINTFVYQHGPNFMIASVLPIAAVGHYALATGLIRQLGYVLAPVSQVLYPAAAELHVRGVRPALERLYHDGSRLLLLVLISVVLPAAFWAEDFYRLWIGGRYLTGAPFQSVAVLFEILLISVVTDNSSNIASQILVGSGHVRTVAMALICGSILNVTMSLVLIRHYGLAGLAMATVIASVAVDLIAMPLLLQRNLGLTVITFLRRSCGRPLTAAALLSVVCWGVRLTGRPVNWLQLISQGALAAIGSAIVVLLVGITAEERRRFVVRPLSRLLAKMPIRSGPVPLTRLSDDVQG